jgi:hypothetical protein
MCGLKAPAGYDNTPQDKYADTRESTVGELERVHATLKSVGSTLHEIHSTLKAKGSSGDTWGVLCVFAVIFLLGSWPSSRLDRFTDRVWYSVAYDADWKNVNVVRMPTDCDFLHAPIGTKRCSYKKHALIFGEKDRQILIGVSTTPEEKATAAKEPNSVTVTWDRKEEP